MFKVDSRKTTTGITRRLLRTNRGKNLILILAIVMTTGMFTTLFTAASSMIASRQWRWMKENMEFSHITVENLTEEQLAEMKKDEGIVRSGYQIFLTEAENPELEGLRVKIFSGDLQGARSSMSQPTKGKMPEAYDEIAMNTVTMDLLGVPHELGTAVTLAFTLSGQKQSQEFTLSGYWSGDAQYQEQKVWVSESFYKVNAGKSSLQVRQTGENEGRCSLFIWCRNTLGLRKYAGELEEKYHLENTAASAEVNSALDLFGEDGFSYGTAGILLSVIFLSGYLIIYHVFCISVTEDIQVYGLLKSIGATERQLKRIVRGQAFFLSGAGIPLGLLVGYDMGKWMTPYLLADKVDSGMEVFFSASPWIFAVSAAFALAVVFIGCMRPCRIAAKIPPVEAVKMTDRGICSVRKRQKEAERFTPSALAWKQIKGTWKKAALAVLSLALPIVLLNVTCGIRKGFHFETYLDTYCTFDFEVSGLTANRRSSNLKAVTPELAGELRGHPDVEKVSLLYVSETMHRLSETGYENLTDMINQAEKSGRLEGKQLEKEKKYLEERSVISRVMGINETALEKMRVIEGEADYEKMKSGNYVLLEYLWRYEKQPYAPGDRLTVSFENGRSKEYTVLGIVVPPYDLTYSFNTETLIPCKFFLPEEEYLFMEGNKNAMMIGVDVKDGQETAFAEWLSGCAEASEKTVYVKSRQNLLEECRAYARSQYMILGILCGVLFVVGTLNFMNTFAASFLARKQELALLGAVGMTGKQMRKMLRIEFLLYAVMAVILADTAGMAAAGAVMEKGVATAFFFQYETVIWPSLFVLPVIGGMTEMFLFVCGCRKGEEKRSASEEKVLR